MLLIYIFSGYICLKKKRFLSTRLYINININNRTIYRESKCRLKATFIMQRYVLRINNTYYEFAREKYFLAVEFYDTRAVSHIVISCTISQ